MLVLIDRNVQWTHSLMIHHRYLSTRHQECAITRRVVGKHSVVERRVTRVIAQVDTRALLQEKFEGVLGSGKRREVEGRRAAAVDPAMAGGTEGEENGS